MDNPGERSWLEGLRELGDDTVHKLQVEDLWRLYALSRVSDTFIHGIVSGTVISDDYEIFMFGLGLKSIPDVPFHPFFHELVSVTNPPDENADIALLGSTWPGFMCGSLLIARGDVSVSAGGAHVRKSVAESSTLYWAFCRSNRPTEDLSLSRKSHREKTLGVANS